MSAHKSKAGSALVITLLVITVLSVIVIAFLTSMSTERLTANSYASLEQAEMAVAAAIDDMTHLLSQDALESEFFLIGSYQKDPTLGPITLLGSKNLRDTALLTPLLSGDLTDYFQQRSSVPSALDDWVNALAGDRMDRNKTVDLNFSIGDSLAAIDSNVLAPTYPARWRYITDSNGEQVARYAYCVLDEQAKINLNFARGFETKMRDKDIVDGSDINVASAQPGYLSEGELTRLNGLPFARDLPLIHFGQAFDSAARARRSRELFTALSNPEPDLIPAGYYDKTDKFVDYPDAGKPKFNINELATKTDYGATASERAEHIAELIDKNLPTFKSRDTSFGLAGDLRYVRRIAASIVDYIDTDRNTTTLLDGEPAGMDLQGVLAAIIEEYIYKGVEPNGAQWDAVIDHTVYVELWNPYSQDITNGQFRLQLESWRPVKVPGAVESPLPVFDQQIPVSVRANEFRVFRVGTQTAKISTPTQPSSGPSMDQTGTAITTPRHSRFKAFWDGTLCNWTPNGFAGIPDRGPGLVKGSVSPMNVNVSYWAGNLSQHSLLAGKGYRAVADPRQNYSQNYNWTDRSPTSASFLLNGRSDYVITGTSTGQDFRQMWIGRDFLPRSPIKGEPMGSNRPESVGSNYVTAEKDGAPSVIANKAMASIGELGNIYDPANVNEIGLAATGGSPSAWSVSGGGRTLKVGQPERRFLYPDPALVSGSERKAPHWDTPGLSANHLLDLFTVKPLDASKVPKSVPRLNINTASREALIALTWNLKALGDPIEADSKISRAKAEIVADAIIAGRPYNNYKEFEKVMNELVKPAVFDPSLGPSAFAYPTYLQDPTSPTEVKTALVVDRTVEGSFRRLVENIGITSRTLRVVIIGQALSRQGNVRAQSRRELIVELEVQPDGAKHRLRPRIYSSKSL